MLQAIGISGPGGAGGIAAGASTTARLNGSDKSANITLADSDRTAQIANGTAGAVRDSTGFTGSSAKLYGEFVVTVQSTTAGGDWWRVGMSDSSVSLANGLGGLQARGTDYDTNSLRYFLSSSAVAGGPTLGTSSIFGKVITGTVIQWQVAYGFLWFGISGTLTGLTDVQAQAGLGAAASGLTGTMFLMFYLDGSGAGTDPSLSIAATTTYNSPAISGNAVY